jgi:hypothetical protein
VTLSASDALALLNTMAQFPDAAGSKAAWIAIMQAAGPVDPATFIVGDPSERFLEIGGRAMGAWGVVPTQAAKGLFLHLATDPGDVDDFGNPDLSADQTPRPGFLSALGLGWFGVTRGEQTFATTFLTVKNNGATTTAPFKAGELFAEFSGASRSDGGTPTYRSTADDAIYTGLGGTLTIAAGASVVLPFEAQQIGSYGGAGVNQIDTLVTQSFAPVAGDMVITASTVAIGQEREDRVDYIARCEIEADKLSPGGPVAGYLFAMNTAKDGTPLQRHDDSGPVGITRAYVSPRNAQGNVVAYFADDDGPADATDVASANANIEGVVLGVITNPIGVQGGAMGYSGSAATGTTVAVTYTVKAKAAPGVTTGGVETAIADALAAYFSTIDIGGYDQTAGAGTLYADKIKAVIAKAWPTIYHTTMAAPSADVALALGHVAVLGAITPTVTLV